MKKLFILTAALGFYTLLQAQTNVGVGTNNPQSKLHINEGSIYVQDNRVDQNPYIIFDIPGVDFKEGGMQWKRNGAVLATFNYIANPNLPNYVRLSMQSLGTAPDLVVNTAGNTGMGLINPAVKLHLYDRNASEMLRIDALNPLIQLRRRTSADNVITAVWKDIGFIQTSGDNLRIGTNSDNDLGKFVIRTNGTDRVFVDQSGNVSIGTQDVAAGYKLNVLGKMICEELKVQLKGAWPDYVFTKDYGLMPLNELKAYVATQQHLPNIPAAGTMEREGIEMGEMQRRMMEKIEELTLYILQQQEQIDTLKKNLHK